MNDPLRAKAPASAQTFDRRLKSVTLTAGVVASLLQLDGSFALKMSGYPKNAVIVGMKAVVIRNVACMVCYLYHPDFPVIPFGTEPPTVKVTVSRHG